MGERLTGGAQPSAAVLNKTNRYAISAVGFKDDLTADGRHRPRTVPAASRNPSERRRVYWELTGVPPASARRANDAAEQGEANGGRDASWGAPQLLPDGRRLRRATVAKFRRCGG